MSIHGICFGRRGIGASLRPGLPRTGNAAHSARCLLPALLTVLCTVPVASPGADGGALYARHCAQCHDNAQGRVPARAHLEGLPPRAIVRALETGSMRVIGTFALSGPDRTAIAAYLAGSPPGEATEPAPLPWCADRDQPYVASFDEPFWNGWGNGLRNTRSQSAAGAGFSGQDLGGLTFQWAFAFPDETLVEAQPTVVSGRLFVGSRSGRVYALDATSGCVHWTFDASAAVKSAVTIATARIGARETALALFGDLGGIAYALDAGTGELLWQKTVDTHPLARISGGLQVFDGAVYIPVTSNEEGAGGDPGYECCTARGLLLAVELTSGRELWRSYTTPPPEAVGENEIGTRLWGPSGAGIWSAVAIDTQRRLAYAATGDNYSNPPTPTSDAILALSLDDGAVQWVYQGLIGDAWNAACSTTPAGLNCPAEAGPDFDMGSSPVLLRGAKDGRDVLLAGQKSGVVHAIDPDNGALLWRRRIGNGGELGGIQFGPAADRTAIYAAISDVAFSGGGILSADIAFDPAAGGGIYALSPATGKLLWQHDPIPCAPGRARCSPAQSAAVSLIPGAVLSGDLRGVLRAYSTADGTLLWEYDSVREFTTVNGVRGRGGAMDAAGAVAVDGWLYFNSGYSKFSGHPGNVLLAFKLDGTARSDDDRRSEAAVAGPPPP